MPDEPFNPYAAPTVSTPQQPEPEARSHRMPEHEIVTTIRLLIVSELAFASGWLLFFVSMLVPYNFSYWAGSLGIWGALAAFTLAWAFVVVLMIHLRGLGMLMIALIVPVPIVGSLAFLVCIRHARQRLIINGYAPRFLGASPDETEREAMKNYPFYTPSVPFDRSGSKRNLSISITGGLLSLVALGIFALILLAG